MKKIRTQGSVGFSAVSYKETWPFGTSKQDKLLTKNLPGQISLNMPACLYEDNKCVWEESRVLYVY